MPRIIPRLTATKLQITTYLLGIALFSISFLVFLNSSISFVVTHVIGQKKHVGDAVGTLGFADEVLALVACPLWGLISDRVGVRPVAVAGYCIIGFSLVCLVQSENVYPELLLGRLGFSIGGAACSTMVTAVLPAMFAEKTATANEDDQEQALPNGHAGRLRDEERPSRNGSIAHAPSPSVSSELTITPHRYASSSRTRSPEDESNEPSKSEEDDKTAGTSQIAGFVGLFTGAGALLALVVFLPLPTYFQGENGRGQSPAQAVQTSFYIVGAIAVCVAVFIFFGLRNLPGEEEKSLSNLLHPPYDESTKTDDDGNLHITLTPAPSYFILVKEAVKLGFTDSTVALGYLGGFVARASSVGVSLFIPLFVNAYFIREGLCTPNPDNLTDIKKECERAYKLASALTGIAETAALICAPLFGWLGGKIIRGHSEWPLLVAALVGIAGYISFGFLEHPDPFHGKGGRSALLSVILIGISQIGSIVCSLGLLGRGINKTTKNTAHPPRPGTSATVRQLDLTPPAGADTAPLLGGTPPSSETPPRTDRSRLKGSIAGVYSFAGGAGILLLTKLGGKLFDTWTPGAPFFILAVFNALLAIAVVAIGGGAAIVRRVRLDD
ncbi:Hypothetical protein R9X50_00084700 [Acrodontium crateriforme]|uniref:MFS transporter n=1 Tax=Acrodontium crateriforme TaxID=150365 RepID=A0AAQ3R9J0_9PEZI|nr:Hypothetical protein R9X50_00084700 [Acrodontium crateriforme]